MERGLDLDGYDFDGHRLRVELAHGLILLIHQAAIIVLHAMVQLDVLITADHKRRAGDVCFSDVHREAHMCVGMNSDYIGSLSIT